MTHTDSGRRCLVLHRDGEGSCIRCGTCGQWIRPKYMAGECLGHPKTSLDDGAPADSGKVVIPDSWKQSTLQSIAMFLEDEAKYEPDKMRREMFQKWAEFLRNHV